MEDVKGGEKGKKESPPLKIDPERYVRRVA